MDFELRPASVKHRPLLWFKSFVFWNESGEQIREIEFRRGLNIVWSPQEILLPTGDGPAVVLKRGKTLMARFLRYCMGEEHFGTEHEQRQIVKRFPNGLVGAVIVLGGVEWSVVRSLVDAKLSAADMDIPLGRLRSQLESRWGDVSFPTFRGRIKAALTPQIATTADPAETALGFVGRDHDNGFDDVFCWHGPNHNSGTPPPREQRARDLCALLGVMVPASTISQHKRKVRDAINAEALNQMRARVASAIGLPWNSRQDADQLLRRAGEILTQAQNGLEKKQDELRAERDRLGRVELSRKLNDQEKRQLETQLSASQKKLRELLQSIRSMKKHQIQEDEVCSHARMPVQSLLSGGKCLLKKAGCDPRSSSVQIEQSRKEAKSLEQDILNMQSRKRNIENDLKQSKEIELRDKVQALETSLAELRCRLADAKACEHMLEGIKQQFPSRVILKGKRKKKNSNQTQMITSGQNCGQLKETAQKVAEQLIASDATTKLAMTERGFDFWCEQDGVRAANLLNVLCFDLAVLVMSIEADISHPGLLIHDCPRQDDISDNQYRKLFEFGEALERGSADEPLFQYILTTSSEPPQNLQGEHVVLKLVPEDSSWKNHFLLRDRF